MSLPDEKCCPMCGATVLHPLETITPCTECQVIHANLWHYLANLPERERELAEYLRTATEDELAQLSPDYRHDSLMLIVELRRLQHALDLAHHAEAGAHDARTVPDTYERLHGKTWLRIEQNRRDALTLRYHEHEFRVTLPDDERGSR